MDEDKAQRIGRLFGAMIILSMFVMVIVTFVDRKIKQDIVAEAAELRAVIGQEQALRQEVIDDIRRGTADAADEADRGDARPGGEPVVPVVDDPGTPPEGMADADTADGAAVDGGMRVPHRGGVDAGGTPDPSAAL